MPSSSFHFGMARLLRLLALAVFIFFTIVPGSPSTASARDLRAAGPGSLYYYADGLRVDLKPSLQWLSVKFTTNDREARTAALGSLGALVGPLDQSLEIPNPSLMLLPVQKGLTTESLVEGIQATRASMGQFAQASPVFETPDVMMAMTDEFIATFPAGMSRAAVDTLNASNHVEMVEPILGQENTFVLRVLSSAGTDVLGMANRYQEQGLALQAAPNFVRMKPLTSRPEGQGEPLTGPMAGTNDTYYGDQWHLNNLSDIDIDAPEAWNVSVGSSSVIIAVIDEGTDRFHEDLSAKMVPGYDATGGGSGGSPSGNDAHGTNVAGLAAAVSNNSKGVAGVCRGCRIMPVRIAYGYSGHWITYDSWIANAIAWSYLQGASILSNSWGGGSPSTVINNAISNAKAFGRGGKGAVVIFASGNDDVSTVSYPASLSTVMAVGATNLCDERKTSTYDSCNYYEYWWGGNYGTALDISAPGVALYSTDITGGAGYYPGNYSPDFNGTSGATPIVSGVAGLILSVNPALTATQVQSLLEITADDVNGGGWDTTLGHGRVNAYNAVIGAKSNAIVVTVGSFAKGAYGLAVNQSQRVSYAGLDSGPVRIQNYNSTPIIASERVAYTPDGGANWTSFSELMGLPSTQLTTSYLLPWYNNSSLNTQLRFGNVGRATTTVTVTIGGVVRGSYAVGPNQSVRVSYPGLDAGPVKIQGSNSVPIIASERVAYTPDGGANWTSFSELMGLPRTQLTTSYVLPWYNNSSLNTQLRFGNVSTVGTTVKVTIGGILQGSYAVGPNQSVRVSYPGLDAGPVKIESSGGVPIIASERVAYTPDGGANWTSFSELMGLPSTQLTTSYVLPWYNNSGLNTQLRFGNVGAATTTVTVRIGGVVKGAYTLAPNQSVRVSYAGLDAGPVKISSSGGVPIIASERVAYTPDGGANWTSFSELMGLPSSQLTTSYVLPWYNNTSLNTQLRFGVP